MPSSVIAGFCEKFVFTFLRIYLLGWNFTFLPAVYVRSSFFTALPAFDIATI